MTAKVSIIIPVYNVSKVLKYTLESIVTQTLQDIEIICIDDCSDDNCRNILNEYASKDSRIKILFHERNSGLVKTRKDGILEASGKYIMFLDGDDVLTKNACECAFNTIEKEKVDMVQFGTHVTNCARMAESTIQQCEKSLVPNLEKIERENLISAWWKEKRFSVHVWNKIYNADLCKEAYEKLEDNYFLDAEDWYAMISILCIAKSYVGIKDQLYVYNYGLGVTGGANISLERFKGRLTEKYVVDALYRFADTQQNTEELVEIVKEIELRFLDNCINLWKNLLLPEYRSEGFKYLLDMWGIENVLCRLAEREWELSIKLSELLLEVDYFKRAEKKNCDCLNIAAYIPFDINCKVKQELERLADNHIIFITDETVLEQKCADTLPNYKESKKEKYRQRFQEWKRLIEKYQIDVVITWGTEPNVMFWDMLAVKGHVLKPAYVVCSREFCCTPYRTAGYDARKLMKTYEICDGVIVSSEYDERFISAFSEHVKYIPVPIEMHEVKEGKKFDNHIIVWNCKISPESHPLDLIHAMRFVLDTIQDAELYILGEYHGNSKIMEQLEELIKRLGVVDSVHFSSEEDKEALYKMACVYVCTSEIENAWNSIGEAMLWKIPVISYDMPWLPLFKDGRGIKIIKQGRWDLLAKEIVSILNNRELAIQLGNMGCQNALEYNSRDFKSEWQMFFKTIFEVKKDYDLMGAEQILYRYLNDFQDLGKRRAVDPLKKKLDKEKMANLEHSKNIKNLNSKIKEFNSKGELNLKVKELERKISIIESSTTFKIGKVIMFLPIKVKLFLKRVFM